MSRLGRRNNKEWLAALRREPADVIALKELRGYLRRVIIRGTATRRDLRHEDIADFTQEAMLRVLKHLDTFRGEAAFRTWAAAIAIRVAFAELRQRDARVNRREVLDQLFPVQPGKSAGSQWQIDATVARRELLKVLEQAIASQLTSRQRAALLAEIRGIPTREIAARLGTNPNALYKLIHDARKKLKLALIRAGVRPEDLRDELRGISPCK